MEPPVSGMLMTCDPGCAPNASPKLATSTPSSFSFVLMSKPVNNSSPPHRSANAAGQIGRPRQLVAGADAGREDDGVDAELAAVGEAERAHAAVAGEDLLA